MASSSGVQKSSAKSAAPTAATPQLVAAAQAATPTPVTAPPAVSAVGTVTGNVPSHPPVGASPQDDEPLETPIIGTPEDAGQIIREWTNTLPNEMVNMIFQTLLNATPRDVNEVVPGIGHSATWQPTDVSQDYVGPITHNHSLMLASSATFRQVYTPWWFYDRTFTLDIERPDPNQKVFQQYLDSFGAGLPFLRTLTVFVTFTRTTPSGLVEGRMQIRWFNGTLRAEAWPKQQLSDVLQYDPSNLGGPGLVRQIALPWIDALKASVIRERAEYERLTGTTKNDWFGLIERPSSYRIRTYG